MPFVTTREMLKAAQAGGYAVGAFNIENMEMAQAVVAAAEKMQSPVIIQTTPSTAKFAPPAVFQAIVKTLAEKSTAPIALHLDHGDSLDLVKLALSVGYSSVMIDGSKLSFEENIALAASAVAAAKPYGVPVEAELGQVGGKEDDHVAEGPEYTDPAKAAEFVARAGIDFLAVAIGTAHGVYRSVPKLDLNRLSEVRKVVSIPLVLHGTSGVPDDTVRECVKRGICKVNYATELRQTFTAAVRAALAADPDTFDPKAFLKPARATLVDKVCYLIEVCRGK